MTSARSLGYGVLGEGGGTVERGWAMDHPAMAEQCPCPVCFVEVREDGDDTLQCANGHKTCLSCAGRLVKPCGECNLRWTLVGMPSVPWTIVIEASFPSRHLSRKLGEVAQIARGEGAPAGVDSKVYDCVAYMTGHELALTRSTHASSSSATSVTSTMPSSFGGGS